MYRVKAPRGSPLVYVYVEPFLIILRLGLFFLRLTRRSSRGRGYLHIYSRGRTSIYIYIYILYRGKQAPKNRPEEVNRPVERILQIGENVWNEESAYRNGEIAAYYNFWNEKENSPLIIVPTVLNSHISTPFTMTIYSSSKILLTRLPDGNSQAISGRW